MFGVLLDVSGSMEQSFEAHYDKRDALTDDNVKRSHGIVTTLNNIVQQEITTYERKDLVFVSAFGLDPSKCKGIDTCDFVYMLEERNTLQEIDKRMHRWEKEYPYNGHRILIEFARSKNAKHAVPWIREKLKQKEAGILWEVLKDDKKLTKRLIDLIPPEGTYENAEIASNVSTSASIGGGILSGVFLIAAPFTGGATLLLAAAAGAAVGAGGYAARQSINSAADNHEALKLARSAVEDKIRKEIKLETILKRLQRLKPHSAQHVSNLLDMVLKENKEASSSRVHEIIDSIKPYIYGGTPMIKALTEAKEIFDTSTEINPKVLFILSDGHAADGDPVFIPQELHKSNVIVVTCYFTSEPIPNPKCLVDKENASWDKGARTLYHMSSTMVNTRAPITHLVDYGWKLPSSGESRLFVQANSLDVVEEFCKVAVSQLTHGTDALVHMLGRISLATYINQEIDDFKARLQVGATCYANAIGAVFHLAMLRIVGRDGGFPTFKAIRAHVIREYHKKGAGIEGATTEEVVKSVCPEYRLRYRKVDEEGARQAINGRRPVVARFSWTSKQKEMFEDFYERSPKAILSAKDVAVEGTC